MEEACIIILTIIIINIVNHRVALNMKGTSSTQQKDFLDPKGKDYQLHKLMQEKSERRQLELARTLIEKRASKVELKLKQKAATDDISPFSGNLFIRHG